MRSSLFCITLVLSILSVNAQRFLFEGISEVKPLKRGVTYQIMWSGGDDSDQIDLELIKDNRSLGLWEQKMNKGFASIKLPLSIKPGKGYYFKISNKKRNTVITTDPFMIRRKTPLATKIAIFTGSSLAIMTVYVIKTSYSAPDS